MKYPKANSRPDHVSPETRSRIMAAIRSKRNRSTEWKLQSALTRAKLRGWQMHRDDLPGTPDFVFNQARLAIFVDGCFWHGCPKCYRRPFTSRDYWDSKVARNRKRDLLKRKTLRAIGWRVLRFWEHDLASSPQRCIQRILAHSTPQLARCP